MQTSVVNYKDLNSELRIDAEYYRAEVLRNIKLLDKKDSAVLGDLASFVIGPFGSTVTVEQYVPLSNYRYVRNKDINDFQISDDEQAHIPEQVYKSLPQFHIKENDLLITVVGTLGKVALAQKKDATSIFSCKSTIIRAKKIDPVYLLAYLNSSIGQLFSLRGVRGAIQQGLNLSDLKEIKVFLPSESFQKNVQRMVSKAFDFSESAGNFYVQAEQILLSELGLLDWKPKHRLAFVKKYSDTDTAGRIDAEYFQPMYDEILTAVKKYRHSFESVSALFRQNRSGFKNKPDELYQYVEISSVNTSSGEINPLSLSGKELPANAKIRLNSGDLIISKVRTYRGAVAIIHNNGLVGSGAFTVLKESGRMNKETAYVFFKSAPILRLSLKYNAGTSYPVIDDKDILNLPFPLIPETIQKDVKQKITDMYDAKALSKRLLDIAKHGVEMAIQKSEKEAKCWIDSELEKLGVTL